MKSLRYICAQPAILYYTWQVEVMIDNFLNNGVSPQQMHIVCLFKEHIPSYWLKLQEKYKDVGFFFYNDTRGHHVYTSSVRPHALTKHFTEHPYLKDEAIFYHDCDMLLTQPVDWEQFLNDDIWYLSDTVSYIGANYIKSKKYGVYERMCEIVNISESVPVKNEKESGGAQYIMKNIDARFWQKVYNDSEALYQFFLDHLKAFPESPTYHPIQKWTSDMWAVLWNAWYFNHETKVVPEMAFAWPGHPVHDWKNKYIFHNAGVTGNNPQELLFYKGKYINSLPYNDNFDWVSKDKCSFKYVEQIIESGISSCLL